MANSGNTEKRSVHRSALLLLFLAIAVVVMMVFVAFNLDLLGNLIAIAAIVIVAIVVIVIMTYVAMALLALPYYAAKGETYQTDVPYDLDDVKAVKEKDSEQKEGS